MPNNPLHTLASLALCGATLLASTVSSAQDNKDAAAAPAASAAACTPTPGAPAWLPCGPDRTLTEDEVRTLVLKEKEGLAAKMTGTSGTSGKDFFINFYPGGKLETGQVGGRNWGKGWKFEGGKLCRDYYAPATGRHCGVFEVSGGSLYLFDDGDAKKSRLSAIEYVKP